MLEVVEVVGFGHDAEPAVFWQWRQGQLSYQAQVTVLSLMEAVDYQEWLEPPPEPSADDWLGLVVAPSDVGQAARTLMGGL